MKSFLPARRFCLGCLAAASLFAAAGCTQTEPVMFRLNLQGRDPQDFYVTWKEENDAARDTKKQNGDQLGAVATILYAMFGEPDAPYVLPEMGLDLRKIELAAGPA